MDNITEEEEQFLESHDHSCATVTNSDNENTLDQYYQCIICGPMFFQSKKKNYWKRLWKARVNASATSNSSRSQQLTHEQPYPSNPDQYYHLSNETSVENCFCFPQNQEKQTLQAQAMEQETSTIQSVLRNCCANSNSDSTMDLLDGERKARLQFRAFMNQLKKGQLEPLCQAVEGLSTDVSSGKSHQATNCVLVQRQKIQGEEPQVIACRLWRWNDLYDPNELRRIPKCPNEKDPIYICCNPVHWSRLCQPGNEHLRKFIRRSNNDIV